MLEKSLTYVGLLKHGNERDVSNFRRRHSAGQAKHSLKRGEFAINRSVRCALLLASDDVSTRPVSRDFDCREAVEDRHQMELDPSLEPHKRLSVVGPILVHKVGRQLAEA